MSGEASPQGVRRKRKAVMIGEDSGGSCAAVVIALPPAVGAAPCSIDSGAEIPLLRLPSPALGSPPGESSFNVTRMTTVSAWCRALVTSPRTGADAIRANFEQALCNSSDDFSCLYHQARVAARNKHTIHCSAAAEWEQQVKPGSAFLMWVASACQLAAVARCYDLNRQIAPGEHDGVRQLRKQHEADQHHLYEEFARDNQMSTQDLLTMEALAHLRFAVEAFAARIALDLEQQFDMQHRSSPARWDKWFECTDAACQACIYGARTGTFVAAQYQHTCMDHTE